ncbi:MAG: hypothetical protein U0S12_13050 [Fimbriimonadales bacterium]
MKRLFSSVLFSVAAAAVFAQAPFTIVRPADGSKVKEKVRILFNKNSIPATGYIGIYVDGKFVEATRPAEEGNYLVYVLDTKERLIKDGKLNIEARLFAEGADSPRLIDRSSINVTVENSSSIPIPEDGIKLRYKFVPGSLYIYNLEQRIAESQMTESQARSGSRAAELPLDSEKVRLLFAIDNAYSNGDGLVRIQALTPPGKDHISYTSPDTGEQKKYYDYNMHSIYMKVQNTGRELFTVLPTYFPMEGTAGDSYREDLFALFPLPVLPTDPVKPKSLPWSAGFQYPKLDLEKKDEVKSMVYRSPARGEFLGVEWEMGRPCAKIRHSFEVGMTGAGANLFEKMTGMSSAKIEETIWFALDKHMPIKILRDTTIDRKVENAAGGGGGAAAGGGRAGGPPGGPSAAGAAGGGGGGAAGESFSNRPGGANDFNVQGPGAAGAGTGAQGGGRRGGGFVGRGQGGGPAAAGANAGGGQRGGGAGGGGAAGRVIVRLRIQQIFTLEQ